jgi:hypothetical protein
MTFLIYQKIHRFLELARYEDLQEICGFFFVAGTLPIGR